MDYEMFLLSDVFSVFSIIFYSVVYLPQFYIIFKDKSSKGVSIYTMLFYTQADSLSLISTLLLQLQISLVAIGWFHFLISICMLITVYVYDQHKYEFKYYYLISVGVVFFVLSNVLANIWIHGLLYYSVNTFIVAGTSIAWITTSLYIIGRIPQIVFNHQRRSTEGLSKLMYIFTILGNMFFLLSIITYSTDIDYIYLNIPWIVLTNVNSFLDLFVIFQYYYYSHY